MELKQANRVFLGLGTVTALVLLAGADLRSKGLVLLGLILAFAALAFQAVFCRCPFCGGYLGRNAGNRFCPRCGEKLDG